MNRQARNIRNKPIRQEVTPLKRNTMQQELIIVSQEHILTKQVTMQAQHKLVANTLSPLLKPDPQQPPALGQLPTRQAYPPAMYRRQLIGLLRRNTKRSTRRSIKRNTKLRSPTPGQRHTTQKPHTRLHYPLIPTPMIRQPPTSEAAHRLRNMPQKDGMKSLITHTSHWVFLVEARFEGLTTRQRLLDFLYDEWAKGLCSVVEERQFWGLKVYLCLAIPI